MFIITITIIRYNGQGTIGYLLECVRLYAPNANLT